MSGYPDFRFYCNRCIHRNVCRFYEEFDDLDYELFELTSKIKEKKRTEADVDINFYGLIVLPKPCPFFHEKSKEAKEE